MSQIYEEIKETTVAVYESIKDECKNFVQILRETWPLLLVLLIILLIAFHFADPPPPKRIFMATGGPGSSYEVLGKKYAEYFAKNGITLELISTRGSEENAHRVLDRNDRVQVAFVQSGIINPDEAKGIISLGGIGYEPGWFFYRGQQHGESDERLQAFLKKRIAVGVQGSASYLQALQILRLNGIEKAPNMVSMPTKEGIKALRSGEVDALMVVDGFNSENVQTLLQDTTISLANFKRAKAYAQVADYFESLEIPQGGYSLALNVPHQDTELIATTINIIADEDLHPGIQYLFMEATRAINGKESFFTKRGEFPSFKDSRLPESDIANRFLQRGTPFLMNYLPFWMAEFIDRMFILLLPIAVFVYPILLSIPGYRLKRIKGRLSKVYGDLKFLEQDISQAYNPEMQSEYVERLDALEKQALNLKVPKSIVSDYYTLRSSIDLVRNSLSNHGSIYAS